MRPLALFIAVVAGTARAQTLDLPDSVSLEQALQLLEARSPRTLADRKQIEVVAADRLTAGTWPNPSFNYGGQQLAGGTNTGASMQHQFALEVPLLLFGQQGVRREAVELNVTAEKARVAAALAERRLQVRQAFASLVARQEQQKILEESLTDLERAQNVVKARASAGDRSAYDVARIEAETLTLKVEVMNSGADILDAAGHLAAVLGFAGWTPRATGNLAQADIPTDAAQLWETALKQRPALVAIREKQAAARGSLTSAQRDRFPVPSIALGAQVTHNADSVSAVWGLSVPLPFLDRNQGPIARASAEVESQAMAVEAESAEAHAEVERARGVLLKRREALASLEQQVVDRLPALRKMAEDAYREGRTGILELLDAFRSARELRVQDLQQRESAKLAEAVVISASGLDAPAL